MVGNAPQWSGSISRSQPHCSRLPKPVEQRIRIGMVQSNEPTVNSVLGCPIWPEMTAAMTSSQTPPSRRKGLRLLRKRLQLSTIMVAVIWALSTHSERGLRAHSA